MAAQGLRDTGDGVEKIANGRVVAELRGRGRTVRLFALGSALLTTALVLAALAL
jgi:hypothetical protein